MALVLAASGCGDSEPGGAIDAAPADGGGSDPVDASSEMIDAARSVTDAAPLGDGAATLAGAGDPGLLDGSRAAARFENPVNVEIDPDTLDVFVADFGNGAIRRVAPDGTTSTVTYSEDDTFFRPFGLALAGDGTLYVQTDGNSTGGSGGAVWAVNPADGSREVVLDNDRPRGLAVLGDGRVVLSDFVDHTISILDPESGEVTLLAGAIGQPGLTDGTGGDARFDTPYDVAVDANGDLIVADAGNHVLRKVTLDGVVTTFAGDGTAATTDGALADASFNEPRGLAVDDAGTIYAACVGGHVIRSVSGGQVTTVAGSGVQGHADDPDPLQAQFFGLEGVTVTPDGGTIYAADGNLGGPEPYHRVRRVILE